MIYTSKWECERPQAACASPGNDGKSCFLTRSSGDWVLRWVRQVPGHSKSVAEQGLESKFLLGVVYEQMSVRRSLCHRLVSANCITPSLTRGFSGRRTYPTSHGSWAPHHSWPHTACSSLVVQSWQEHFLNDLLPQRTRSQLLHHKFTLLRSNIPRHFLPQANCLHLKPTVGPIPEFPISREIARGGCQPSFVWHYFWCLFPICYAEVVQPYF